MPKRVTVQNKKPKETPRGTVRIKVKDLQPYEKTEQSWKRSSKEFPEAMLVINLFKAHKNLKTLIDDKDPTFLKGQLSSSGKTQGARVGILPNGKKLDKAYSLFAKHLIIHHESSQGHWNVMYQNPGGTYSYLYTREKKNRFIKKKYQAVKEFAKHYPRLKRNTYNALRKTDDHIAVPMYTLLRTYMRIGNEIYYKMHGHKGLTTLKKKDISISGNTVTFNYISKDGVPVEITSTFPDAYISRLRSMMRSVNERSFVFVNGNNGHPLHENHFKDAFRRYCGKEFYPHIVRSYYATEKVKDFLKTRRSVKKEDVRSLYLSIAEKLGHKKFDKNNHVWKENYNVTIHHYVQPELVERVKEVVVD